MHIQCGSSGTTTKLPRTSKHGVPFEEAATCFFDLQQVALGDPDHSEDEEREILIAHSEMGRLLLVVYTLRGETIRIISARRLTPKETREYERGI